MKNILRASILSIAGMSIILAGCGTPEPAPAEAAPPVDMTALKAEIQAMEDAYAAGSVSKDAAAVVAYYADDLVSYSRDEEPTMGKEAMRQRLADRMAKDTTGYAPTFKVLELFVGDDYLTEIGSWEDKDASGAVKDKGTYFSVFRKDEGKWLCIRDISVSSMPKAEPMETAAAE